MDQTMTKRKPRPLRSRPTVTPCGWRIQQRPDLVDVLKDISIGLWGRSFSASEANLALLYRCSIRNAQALRKRLTLSGYVEVRDGVMRIGDSGRRLMVARYPEPEVETLVRLTERAVRMLPPSPDAGPKQRVRLVDPFGGAIGEKRFQVLAYLGAHHATSMADIGRSIFPDALDPDDKVSRAVSKLRVLGMVTKSRGRTMTMSRVGDLYSINAAGHAKLAAAKPMMEAAE
jgi:DNA-binding MarR family transcriptional regulator